VARRSPTNTSRGTRGRTTSGRREVLRCSAARRAEVRAFRRPAPP
jgi:hypothetical protein